MRVFETHDGGSIPSGPTINQRKEVTVKLIKLDRRHHLYHQGYRWTFAGDRWSIGCRDIETSVQNLEGYDWNRTFWGKRHPYGFRPYYIGMRSESTATMALLKI